MRPASGAVTIAHVAAAAQVSVRTVSRVLNQATNVDDRTRETVTTVIEQLGFRRNSRARGLAAGRSFLLGVVQDDPNAHVIAVLQRGIASLCAEEGYELVVHSSCSDAVFGACHDVQLTSS
jgi:LacI family transcriptional regulator